MNRRGFLVGAGALLAAPAIVRVSSLMPVRSVDTGIPASEYGCSPGPFAPRQLQGLSRKWLEDTWNAFAAKEWPEDPPRLSAL